MIQRSMKMNDLALASDALDIGVDRYAEVLEESLRLAEQTVRYLAHRAMYSEASELSTDTVQTAVLAQNVQRIG